MTDVIHRKPRLEIELEEAQVDADFYWNQICEFDSLFPCQLFENAVTGYMEANHRIGKLMTQINCSHAYEVDRLGGTHFSAGDVWDDIRGICSRCGAEV